MACLMAGSSALALAPVADAITAGLESPVSAGTGWDNAGVATTGCPGGLFSVAGLGADSVRAWAGGTTGFFCRLADNAIPPPITAMPRIAQNNCFITVLSFIAAEAAHLISCSRWDFNHTVAPIHAVILRL